jgi:hypothetical protein
MKAFALAVVVTLLPLSVQAEPPEVMTIVKRMKEVFEPARPTTRKVILSISGERDQKTEWVAAQALKVFPEGKRLLTVILSPESLKGNAFLVQEQRDKPTAMWVYSSPLRRVRSLVPVDVYQRFLDSDFTYADLSLVNLHSVYRLLGEEEHSGVRAYKVEEMFPQAQAYYSRILTWIAIDSMLPLERQYYDVAGSLWKKEVFEDVSVINGIATPLHVTMEDVQTRTMTELKVQQVEYEGSIPDSLFDPVQLPQGVQFSTWQAYMSQVAEGK